jgi:hypothetical protein
MHFCGLHALLWGSSSLEKVACGAFSDIGSVSAGKKRGFCQLRSRRYGFRPLDCLTYIGHGESTVSYG